MKLLTQKEAIERYGISKAYLNQLKNGYTQRYKGKIYPRKPKFFENIHFIWKKEKPGHRPYLRYIEEELDKFFNKK